jgi:hypothetical protein
MEAPVVSHFTMTDHAILDFQIVAIGRVREDNEIFRRIRESHWINKMDTFNSGENRQK